MGLSQHAFAWISIDGAVAPTTGDRLFLEWPYLNADTCQRFVASFAQAFPDSFHILLVDNRGTPTAQRLRWPVHVPPLCLPPDGPERHLIARGWRDVKDDLAWQPFVDRATHQVDVGDLWQADHARTLQALTGDAS